MKTLHRSPLASPLPRLLLLGVFLQAAASVAADRPAPGGGAAPVPQAVPVAPRETLATGTATITTLTDSPDPSFYGYPVTLTATVTPDSGSNPTGTVTFFEGTNSLGSASLALRVASLTTLSLPGGVTTLTARYNGDSSFAVSVSPPVTHDVNQASSTTTLTSSLNPSPFLTPTTFTATVAAVPPGSGTPTGSVTFKDGEANLGTGTLDVSGVATFPTSGLSVGQHSITAVYAGNAGFAASTSEVLTQDVNRASSTTALTSSVNPSLFGLPPQSLEEMPTLLCRASC